MLYIGKKLKTLRKKNKLTAQDICMKLRSRDLNYTASSIYKWEENISEPDIYVLAELSKIFKSSLSAILDTEELEMQSLTPRENKMLSHFREDESFMRIAMLLLRYRKKR